MKVIELKNVSIDYPLDSEDGYSLKNTILNYYTKAKSPELKHFRAINGINLEINKGEKIGLIGLNGAGKTTLLRVISGIFQPSSGKLEISGNVSPLLDCATGFEEHMTGIENIRIRLMFLGLPKKEIDAKILEIAKFTELGEFLNQQVRTYSSGMFLRLAFATSTAIEPEILVVDEIIGAGDAQFALKAKNRLDSFLSRDCTMVMSSHSMDLIRRFCQRVIWLHKGEIIADGPITAVLADYEKNAENMSR